MSIKIIVGTTSSSSRQDQKQAKSLSQIIPYLILTACESLLDDSSTVSTTSLNPLLLPPFPFATTPCGNSIAAIGPCLAHPDSLLTFL